MKTSMMSPSWTEGFGALFFLLLSLAMALAGCERERTILDIETPGADLEIREVERPSGRDGVEIELNREPEPE